MPSARKSAIRDGSRPSSVTSDLPSSAIDRSECGSERSRPDDDDPVPSLMPLPHAFHDRSAPLRAVERPARPRLHVQRISAKPAAMRSSPAHDHGGIVGNRRSGGATKRKPCRSQRVCKCGVIPDLRQAARDDKRRWMPRAGIRRQSAQDRGPMRSSSVREIARWNEAQISEISCSVTGAIVSAAWRTAVFRPEKEKSSRVSPTSAGENRTAWIAGCRRRSTAGRPDRKPE